jgi:hypothetical protein
LLARHGRQQLGLVAEVELAKLTESEVRARVHTRLQAEGVRATSRALGLSRDATLALAAGARVHAGTMALARLSIAETESKP